MLRIIIRIIQNFNILFLKQKDLRENIAIDNEHAPSDVSYSKFIFNFIC